MTKKEKIENFIEEYNGYLITSLVCSEDISKTYIAKYIKSTCNISYIKSDIVYKEWENELVKYNETVKKKLEIMRMQ